MIKLTSNRVAEEKTGFKRRGTGRGCLFHSMKEALTRGERIECGLWGLWLKLASEAWVEIRAPGRKSRASAKTMRFKQARTAGRDDVVLEESPTGFRR